MIDYIITGLAIFGAFSVLCFIGFLIEVIVDSIKDRKETKEREKQNIRRDIWSNTNLIKELTKGTTQAIDEINRKLDIISKQLENKVDKTEDDITLEEVEKMCLDVDRAVFERLNLK